MAVRIGWMIMVVMAAAEHGGAEEQNAAGENAAGKSGSGLHQLNHLAGEKSPYLMQHVRNPVDWYPWGPAAFAKARKENKPILLSIGYSTCHWCHVMERAKLVLG